jgi:molecular chaperone GrpE
MLELTMAEENKVETPDNGAAPAAPTAEGPPATEALERELEAVKAKAAENLDGWLRAQAEFQNYRRRVERDRADLLQDMTGKIIARYLDVLDDFDRALKHQPAEADGAATLAKWAQGVGAIQRKFQNVLDTEGVSRIEAEGQAFDPNLHEAVVHEDSETHASGQIIEVLRHGYKIGDRVIRPALVKVAK